MIPSVSSNSCSSSRRIPSGVRSSVPCSSWIPSLNELDCSCSTLITFWNVVSRTFVFVSQLLIVPVWPDETRVFPAAKVPDTSFKTKCALKEGSGGLLSVYLNPAFVIFVDLIEPISVVVACRLALIPEVLVIETVGSLV